MYHYEIAARIADDGVVAIVREKTQEEARVKIRALLKAGQRVVEVSVTTPGAIELVAELRDDPVASDAVIGIGTVLDETTARLGALAGARFVVSPSVDTEVLRTAHRYGMATLPGAFTATEAVRAVAEGADFVKLFPASAYGPASVQDVMAALPQIALVPTGGVSLEAAPAFIGAGAVAVGMGGALTCGPAAELPNRVRELHRAVTAAKEGRRA
ncbi:2-dehydro-3-deoxyphosphogluconate aldolase [Streptomyces sp. NPDC006967]|uniref:bifunctional 4-hydroxy-2-oxoglutarate aldolase/2-dehydro-3-deoxy-phosphogluconate aldolase n=1 Tax=unclassified Streptomyces TaxID=2593676 RepID=UPI000CD4BB9F|nr:2-dehydro-3-deoxyphosphogluconate aldolase [Streptomyces sp. SM1]